MKLFPITTIMQNIAPILAFVQWPFSTLSSAITYTSDFPTLRWATYFEQLHLLQSHRWPFVLFSEFFIILCGTVFLECLRIYWNIMFQLQHKMFCNVCVKTGIIFSVYGVIVLGFLFCFTLSSVYCYSIFIKISTRYAKMGPER